MQHVVQLNTVPLIDGPQETALRLLSWDMGSGNQLPGRIIYAGRFDPPTRAHQAVVAALDLFAQLLAASLQGSWEVVLWPHEAYGDKEVHAHNDVRKAWMQRLVQGLQVTSLYDVWTDGAGKRPYVPQMDMYREYRTLRLLARGGEAFTVPVNVIQVIGADNVANIRTWEEPEALWKRNWLIVPRPGSVLPDEQPPQSHVLGSIVHRRCRQRVCAR